MKKKKTAKKQIKNDSFIYLSLKTGHGKTQKKTGFKCFTQEEQNLSASTNNSYKPRCYEPTIKQIIPTGDEEWYTGIPLVHCSVVGKPT